MWAAGFFGLTHQFWGDEVLILTAFSGALLKCSLYHHTEQCLKQTRVENRIIRSLERCDTGIEFDIASIRY
jgi:hypothetical protein